MIFRVARFTNIHTEKFFNLFNRFLILKFTKYKAEESLKVEDFK